MRTFHSHFLYKNILLLLRFFFFHNSASQLSVVTDRCGLILVLRDEVPIVHHQIPILCFCSLHRECLVCIEFSFIMRWLFYNIFYTGLCAGFLCFGVLCNFLFVLLPPWGLLKSFLTERSFVFWALLTRFLFTRQLCQAQFKPFSSLHRYVDTLVKLQMCTGCTQLFVGDAMWRDTSA